MTSWTDEAVVLGSRKSAESNRVVFLLTRDHGRVAAAANGVRKVKSSIGARLETMNHVRVLVRPTRRLSVIEEVTLVSAPRRLRGDLVGLSQGMAMVEAVNALAPEGEPVPEIFDLLRRAVATLDARQAPLVLAGFYLKLLALEGSAPMLTECVACGATDGLCGFGILEGGVQCGSCRMGPVVSAGALEIMRMILGGNLRGALAMGESAEVNEANEVVTSLMEAHLERRIRSLGVFDRHL